MTCRFIGNLGCIILIRFQIALIFVLKAYKHRISQNPPRVNSQRCIAVIFTSKRRFIALIGIPSGKYISAAHGRLRIINRSSRLSYRIERERIIIRIKLNICFVFKQFDFKIIYIDISAFSVSRKCKIEGVGIFLFGIGGKTDGCSLPALSHIV